MPDFDQQKLAAWWQLGSQRKSNAGTKEIEHRCNHGRSTACTAPARAGAAGSIEGAADQRKMVTAP